MKENNNVANMDGCVGCGLCASACPRNAISLVMGENGFIVPQVDSSACVDCGICVKKCVVADKDKLKAGNQDEPRTYAAWSRDKELRKSSSSGGLFTEIAKTVLEKGGCVFGVKWQDAKTAVFACAETMDELSAFRGSKYVPAFAGRVYKEVKAALDAGRYVLFSGTPCQVYALRSFLRKDYSKLFMVDIVCHGMPSYNIFLNYKNELEYLSGKNLREMVFRDKVTGWARYSVARHMESEAVHQVTHNEDDFMRLFLSDKALNETCYNCPFITHGRQGDLTLGDFWGISRFYPKWDTRLGVSVVVANNEKGRDMMERLRNESLYVTNVPRRMVSEVANHTIPFAPRDAKKELPSERENVLKSLRENRYLSTTISKYLGYRHTETMTYHEKNVALFGFWESKNYGAHLTSVSLYKALEDLGWRPTMISVPIWNRDLENTFLRKLGIRFSQLHRTREDYLSLNKHFSSFVVGSDQLWRYRFVKSMGHLFYLDFAAPGKRRVAYGTSLGTNPCEAPQDYRDEASMLLSFFSGVSSREREGVEVLERQYRGTKAEFVLDPVFLTSLSRYRDWAKLSEKRLPEGEYVLSYIMDADTDGSMQELIKTICRQEKAGMLNMVDLMKLDEVKASIHLENLDAEVSTEDWLHYIINCKHFVTDSFHGMCFALMFNKPFTVVANKLRGYSRFTSMLSEFGLRDYLLESPADYERVHQLPVIDWAKVNARIEELRVASFAWLKKSMEIPLDDASLVNQNLYYKSYRLMMELENAEKRCAQRSQNELNTARKHDTFRANKSNANLKRDFALVLSYRKLRWKYLRYRLFSKIVFGRKRKKYIELKKQYKLLLRQAREARRQMCIMASDFKTPV